MQDGVRSDSGNEETLAEREELGTQSRGMAPRSSHADWTPDPARPDPVTLVEQSNEDRIDWLVPTRRMRMLASPFAFFRGSPGLMAADLAGTPDSELSAQINGDAHLLNFGFFSSPSRRLVFDINDCDETLVGPWEWDLKRLATSAVIGARDLDFPKGTATRAAHAAVLGYAKAMNDFADRGYLESWHTQLGVGELSPLLPKKRRRRISDVSPTAKARTRQQALGKLAKVDGERLRIRNLSPLLVPVRRLEDKPEILQLQQHWRTSLASYADSLTNDTALLLGRYEFVDAALKTVGVGSLGTRTVVVLGQGRDASDPLFLQVREARRSSLEEYLPGQGLSPSERIVRGKRVLQAEPDIFLGMSAPVNGRGYYWRQLRDWKSSVRLERLGAMELNRYANVCGWSLAHAHARSGDPVAIAAYIGSGRTLAGAIAEFAKRYAEQNLADYQAYQQAVADRSLEVAEADLE
ncbi:MAG: DUF2252 domain-containing protein [Actinobacteria bacterium]|nr:DUF2252 domain-containing protein [Actinomycetota bacterium]